MSSIKFNYLTKEIELKGSESFIESNFYKIQNLLIESFGVKKMIAPRKTKISQEPISVVKVKESQTSAEITGHELSEASAILQATKSSMPEISHELKAKRPPLRKYIRKVGSPGHQRTVVEIVEQKPRELSLASLKEKFGLSESKFGGIIRDAEKFGMIKRVMNGSYVWSQNVNRIETRMTKVHISKFYP
jgi:hypothetical protein